MVRVRGIVLIATLLLAGAGAQGQTLIYALSYTDTRASFRARFPTGVFGASNADKLAMLRKFRKTEIYAFSPVSGERKLLFSDEGMSLEIAPTGPVLDKDTVFASGIVHEWRAAPTPGAYADPAALYEIRLDGSKQFRRLQDLQPNQTPAVLNWQRTKAAIESTAKDQYVIAIFEMPAWKLLYRWELKNLTKSHCPDCLPMSFGWLATGDQLFVDLDTGDEDSIDPKNHNVPGIYVASEKGDDLGLFSQPMSKKESPAANVPVLKGRHFVAQLADGGYLFVEYRAANRSPGTQAECFLVVSGPGPTKERRIPVRVRFPGSTYVAPSGDFIAFMEDRTTPQFRSERHVWVVDLGSGKEVEVFVAPPPGLPDAPEPSVTVSILGWADDTGL